MDSGTIGDYSIESGDWRALFQADSRERIVNEIMDTLKMHLPFSGDEGLQELKKIAVRFEEKIYTAATSQSDYLCKVPRSGASQSNSGANGVHPSDTTQEYDGIEFRPYGNQTRHGMDSRTLSSSSLSQSTISNVASQNLSLQNIPNWSSVQQNLVENKMGPGVFPNYIEYQRQLQLAYQKQQQKQLLLQQQRPMLEASSTKTRNANGRDWQEEVYQKIKAMKDLYLLDLNDIHQKIAGKMQQHDSLPHQLKNEELKKLKMFNNMLERFMAFLRIPKHNILAEYQDKLSTYEKQIILIITSNCRKPAATQQPTPPPEAQPPLPPHKQSQQTHSALPLLAKFTSSDGNHGVVASNISGKSSAIAQPLEHLGVTDHSFAPKVLLFLECLLMFLFICYINTILMSFLIA